ncbi:MAG: type II toxin-antitoxin system HipA family toxin [Endomicrobium sp.]|nr:type II toxin-antitoxin system HipA family toxin [Endomicrobium sp.]
MFKKISSLSVYFETDKLGTLAITDGHLCAFEYDAQWLQNKFSVSPFYLPLKKQVFISKAEPFDAMFGVFNDSLPDGWGRLLVDRLLRKNNINPASLTPIERLSIVGSGGMGTLSYKPENHIAAEHDISDLQYLEREVNKVLNDDYTGDIEALAAKGCSSGGARPKVLITINGEHWIVKFKSSSDPKNIGKIEYEYSLAAKKSGIIMTETKLLENKYFAIKRFDRENGKKIHMHTAAGLLNADHRIPSLDYKTLMEAAFALTKDMSEVLKIYRLMIFNVLTSNKDDHSKNFSFIYKDNKWQFSPAYDLVYSEGFNAQHATTMLGEGNPKKEHIFDLAKEMSINRKTYKNIFDEVYAGTADLRKDFLADL